MLRLDREKLNVYMTNYTSLHPFSPRNRPDDTAPNVRPVQSKDPIHVVNHQLNKFSIHTLIHDVFLFENNDAFLDYERTVNHVYDVSGNEPYFKSIFERKRKLTSENITDLL